MTGYTTIHAASATRALSRLRFVAQLSDAARHLPLAALNALVSDAIDLVVHTERGPNGPRVTSVLAVEDLTAGIDSVQFTTTELFRRERGELRCTGEIPVRAGERMGCAGIEVRAVLDPDRLDPDRRHPDRFDPGRPHGRTLAEGARP